VLKKADGLAPTLEAAFKPDGLHLVTAPIDYSENIRVLIEELRQAVPADPRIETD
jgi:acetolactate synthase I/II/III large subunit